MKKIVCLAFIFLLLTGSGLCPAQAAGSVDAVMTAEAQPKIASLYTQLKAFKDEADFHRKGFKEFRRAKVWRLSAEALRDVMAGRSDIAGQVQAAPQALLSLAEEWQRSGGVDTEETRPLRDLVEAAIAWKPSE